MREHLEAYVLGALEGDERAQVERHLESCSECRALLQEYEEVVALLPEALAAASGATPPPALRQALLATVESSARTGAMAEPRPSGDARGAGVARPALSPGQRESVSGSRQQAKRLRLALVAVALLLVLGLAWNIRLNGVLARERALRAEYAELVEQQELVLEVVDSSQTERRFLRSAQEGSRAYGKLFTRADMAHVVAMAARLPPPPPGQKYHLWLVSGGKTNLAGVLNVSDDGFGLLLFDADVDGPTYDAAQVTLQPEGSATPTAPPVLTWQADTP